MRSSITACPNTLHEEKVVTVTRPVTHVDVVAVKSASIYGTGTPLCELTGSARSRLPISMVSKKLSKITCVVDNEKFPFFIFVFLGKF